MIQRSACGIGKKHVQAQRVLVRQMKNKRKDKNAQKAYDDVGEQMQYAVHAAYWREYIKHDGAKDARVKKKQEGISLIGCFTQRHII